jgi:hypothetical protein
MCRQRCPSQLNDAVENRQELIVASWFAKRRFNIVDSLGMQFENLTWKLRH